MALLLTPVSENASRITCTGCPACLVVTSRISALRLRLMVEGLQVDHQCSVSV